ncbi:hypothetical protein J2T60_002062 [Natronospira proteinivora]|uniref:Uncharacterized protein n=1 Tax=Natronospira proteinivora TaxID=1807133 RepID=A0ABT1GDN5_9GAMM|nr:hypothetical protein [Natronospira proteinivora]MCP1728062.1 hypothetical protein [Natronospira proteinivora]
MNQDSVIALFDSSIMRPYLLSASSGRLGSSYDRKSIVEQILKKDCDLVEVVRALCAIEKSRPLYAAYEELLDISLESKSMEAAALVGELFVEPAPSEKWIGDRGAEQYFCAISNMSEFVRDFSLAVYCINRMVSRDDSYWYSLGAKMLSECAHSGSYSAFALCTGANLYMESHSVENRDKSKRYPVISRVPGLLWGAASILWRGRNLSKSAYYWRYNILGRFAPRHVARLDRRVAEGGVPWSLSAQDACLKQMEHESKYGDSVLNEIFGG